MFIAHLLAVGLPDELDETVLSLGAYGLNKRPCLMTKKEGYKIRGKPLPAEEYNGR